MANDYYHAGGGFSDSPGGGFLTTGLNNSQTTPTSREGKKAQNLIPMDVAGIFSSMAKGESLRIADVDVSMVTLVGLVKSVELQSTMYTYVIHDMTGIITVKHIISDAKDDHVEQRCVPTKENTYIRAYGQVRSSHGDVFMTAYRVKPITNPNEITMHLLEVMHSRVSLERQSESDDATKMETDFGLTSDNNFSTGSDYISGLTRQQNLILKVIGEVTGDHGCTKQYMEKDTRLAGINVSKELEFLCEEGHVYTTIDEAHYKVTSGSF